MRGGKHCIEKNVEILLDVNVNKSLDSEDTHSTFTSKDFYKN